jgi:hypothetical protein
MIPPCPLAFGRISITGSSIRLPVIIFGPWQAVPGRLMHSRETKMRRTDPGEPGTMRSQFPQFNSGRSGGNCSLHADRRSLADGNRGS